MHGLIKVTVLISFICLNIYMKFSLLINLAFFFASIFIFVDLKFLRNVIVTFPRDFWLYYALVRGAFYVKRLLGSESIIPDLFEKQARRFADRTLFIHEDKEWSFAQVEGHMNRVANALLAIPDLQRGQVLAVFGESRPEYVATWLGIARAGLVPALINFNLNGDALVRCIEAAKAVGLVFGGELSHVVADVHCQLTNNGCRFFRYGAAKRGSNDDAPANDLDALAADASSKWTAGKFGRKPTDVLLYIYTSGTTGLPKPAIITHLRYFFMASSFRLFFNIGPKDVIYVVLPLYHSAGGCIGIGSALLYGCTAVIRTKFSASAFWSDCVRYKVTIVQYIGELCRYLLAQPPRPCDTAHQVRLALGNGLRPAIWSEFRRRFNLKHIAEFYGATESNANLLNYDNTEGAVGFIPFLGRAFYPVDLVRVDPESGEVVRDSRSGLCVPCVPGEPGMLVGKISKRNPVQSFRGYVSKKATNKKIAHNVFKQGDTAFLSGDILVKDELGYVFFRDRTGDTFRWRGENVSTAEVEMAVSGALKLADCAVYGVEVPGTEGRAGMATIVLNGTPFQPERLWKELSKRLPSYARPLFLRLKHSLEMTGTFKVKKNELMQEGFDVTLVKDQIFFADPKEGTYIPLTESLYQNILSGQVRV